MFFVVSTIRYFFCFVCFKCDYNISLFSFLHPKISYSLFLSTEEKSRRLKLFDLSSYRFYVWAHFFFFWTKSENVCKLRSDNEFGIYGGLMCHRKELYLLIHRQNNITRIWGNVCFLLHEIETKCLGFKIKFV